MKKFLLILSVLISSSLLYAVDTDASGDWSDADTWKNTTTIPNSTATSVTIKHTPIYIRDGETFTINNLRLTNGVKIIIEEGGTLNVEKLIVDNSAEMDIAGTFNVGTGGIDLKNSSDFTVKNTGVVDVEGDVETANFVELVIDGTVTIDGDLLGNATVSGSGTVSVAGTTDASITDEGPLPIELTTFKAVNSDNDVTIYWQTASEKNNDYFTVERSLNGIEYQTIATVYGAGNSSSVIDYSYTDANPLNGITYYRLTQTDYDGQSETFDAVSVSMLSEDMISVGPNPATDYLNISISGDAGSADILIYNVIGEQVKSISMFGNTQNINVSDLAKGTYMVIIAADNDRVSTRIVIQ